MGLPSPTFAASLLFQCAAYFCKFASRIWSFISTKEGLMYWLLVLTKSIFRSTSAVSNTARKHTYRILLRTVYIFLQSNLVFLFATMCATLYHMCFKLVQIQFTEGLKYLYGLSQKMFRYGFESTDIKRILLLASKKNMLGMFVKKKLSII